MDAYLVNSEYNKQGKIRLQVKYALQSLLQVRTKPKLLAFQI